MSAVESVDRSDPVELGGGRLLSLPTEREFMAVTCEIGRGLIRRGYEATANAICRTVGSVTDAEWLAMVERMRGALKEQN